MTERAHGPLEALARAAVARYPATEDATLRFVRHGENTTFRADSPDGRSYALRVARPGYQSRASIASEVAWMDGLRGAGLRTPEALRGADGEVVQEVSSPELGPRLVVAFAWVDGVPLGEIDSIDLWHRLGDLMAAVHDHGAGWSRPAGFTRHAWDEEGMLGETPLWGDPRALWEWDARTDSLIAACQDAVRGRLHGFGRPPERFGLIHADLAFENVLVDADGPVIIDFDDCGWGWYVYDLAVPLFPHEGRDGIEARRDALVAGYSSRRILDKDELRELPTFLMARRLVTLGWTFSHAETEHAQRQRAWRVKTFPAAAEAFLRWAQRTPSSPG